MGFVDKDEKQVQSEFSKLRVDDKILQPGKISMLAKITALENTTENLLQPSTEEVQQRSTEEVQELSDMIQQYKLTELSFKKQNEMLQEELENTRCLLETKNQRASVANAELKKQVEELRKKNGELQERYVKVLQEKKEQRMEFESVHLDLQIQISSLSASQMFLEDKTNSLQREMDTRASLSEEEKVSLIGKLRDLEIALDSLNKHVESSRAMEKDKDGRILYLRNGEHETEKRTSKEVLKERATPKQLAGKQSPNTGREIPWRW